MPLAREIPWTRIFAEAAAIVVSILLAFGIQAWWDNLQERQEEQVLLSGLLVDLQDDSTDYAEAVAEQGRRVLAADLLLYLAGDPAASEEGAAAAKAVGMTPGEAFDQLGRGPRLETVRVSYDQITAAGISEVIEDPELRQRIARYYAVATDWTEPGGSNGRSLAVIAAFETELRRFGFTWSDADRIPLEVVMSDSTFRALIRSSRATSEFAARTGTRLLDVVVGLMHEVEAHLR